MKATARCIGGVILLSALLLSACSLPFTNKAKAKELVREYITTGMVKCGDVYYSRNNTNPRQSEPDYEVSPADFMYEQHKDFYCRFRGEKPNAADRANGITWSDHVSCYFTVSRVCWYDGLWSEWRLDPRARPDATVWYRFHVYKKKGQWYINDSPVSSPSPPDFTCADVPPAKGERCGTPRPTPTPKEWDYW